MSVYVFEVVVDVDPVLTAQAAGLATLEAVPALVAGAVSTELEKVTDHGVVLNGPVKVTARAEAADLAATARLCEALAEKGGPDHYSTCGAPLDSDGRCPNARGHKGSLHMLTEAERRFVERVRASPWEVAGGPNNEGGG